jgi:protein-tyrosine phosphatase/membrane-associated phospholipid phosphatase
MARISRIRQLAASVGLSVLFLIVYGWTNWFTAQRRDVGTLVFDWERFIPFVPWMIVPYMSIDLFFVAAPFVCRDNRELAALSKRIVAATLIAGLCFLLFPLRFAFPRPHADGWLGTGFEWFRAMDQPYNLLPSLHITFLTILADLYARHLRRPLRYASNFWFLLIGLSAVLTYQHHVMDVVAGFALGAYCLYFFPEFPTRLPVMKNRRVGSYYVMGTFASGALAVLFWPWGALLLRLTISLGLAAAAYLGSGPGIFRKGEGRLPWTTWWALGPVLLGHEISRVYYRRQCRAWNELTPRVLIGGVLNDGEAVALRERGVRAVLDLTAEFSERAPLRDRTYKNIPILDLTAPNLDQLDEMASFIQRESERGIVYVHCKAGYSRTAAAAGAYLLRSGVAKSTSQAVDLIRRVRPSVVIRPEVLAALQQFEVGDFSSRPASGFSNNEALP